MITDRKLLIDSIGVNIPEIRRAFNTLAENHVFAYAFLALSDKLFNNEAPHASAMLHGAQSFSDIIEQTVITLEEQKKNPRMYGNY